MNSNDNNPVEQMRNFMISLRTNAKLSQAEVANRSDVFGKGKVLDQRSVSRVENNPMDANTDQLLAYLNAVGADYASFTHKLNEVLGSLVKPATVEQPHSIPAKIEAVESQIQDVRDILDGEPTKYINLNKLHEQINSLSSQLKNLNRKMIIGLFGVFDAAKSTTLNSVLGTDNFLPTGFQPATSVLNLVMHESDRPASITGQVAVFNNKFKPYMIHSSEDVTEHLIDQGGPELLKKFGIHTYDEDSPNDAYMAVIFSDAEILKLVWLMDTPGDLNSSDESDTEVALSGAAVADAIVYVSAHTGFMKDSDLGYASNLLRQKPPIMESNPLAHILFIQSHCHSEIPSEAIEGVGRTAFKRLLKPFKELVFSHWHQDDAISQDSDITSEMLSDRVQPFWRENPQYLKSIRTRFLDMANHLNTNQESITDKYLDKITDSLRQLLIHEINCLEDKKRDSQERIEEVNQQDARFRQQATRIEAEFRQLISDCEINKQRDLETIEGFYQQSINVDSLERLITETYEDKKLAQSEIGNLISQRMTAKLEYVLKRSGKDVSIRIDTLLEKWQEVTPSITKPGMDTNINSTEAHFNGFDSRAAFVGGLSGLASLGAMALYVSTIASNLGAYIIIGKIAGVLASLGLVGSVTTVTSFVAAIGGPITIGIALASAIGYIVYRLAGGSWQRSLAKKVSSAVKESKANHDLAKAVENYWNATATAIDIGLKELILETNTHINHLKEEANQDFDKEQIECELKILSSANDSLPPLDIQVS